MFFQQITWFVETKDRLDAASLMAVYDAVINHLTLEIAKRSEHADAWEARMNGRIAAIGAADDELRDSLAAVQTATAVLKRELERSLQSRPAGPAGPDRPATATCGT